MATGERIRGWIQEAVSTAGNPPLSPALRRIVAEAWAFRWKVELEAEVRFARLAERLARSNGGSTVVVDMARRASDDEGRHARLCQELALAYGHPGTEPELSTPEIAPAQLEERQRLLYELVAACCITETESMNVLTTLLPRAREERVRTILREIARDEVIHSRLGWAHLAREHGQIDVGFIGPLVPDMLQGTVADDLFDPASPDLEDPLLLGHGVLPHSTKRSTFIQTLNDIVFPGLESFGVDSTPGRQWLEQRRARIPAT